MTRHNSLTIHALFTLALLVPSAAFAQASLRTLADARGKHIGTAVATSPLANETPYRNIAGGEFNSITAENVFKWDAIQPSQGNFSFAGADQIVAFATANNQRVHGHTLVWHSQTPAWVQNLNPTQTRTAMENHIATVVGRYASNPVVRSWDVVNEVFDDNGGLRNSFWLQDLGQTFIADAFRAARAADSDAVLCINDYNVEGINAKSTAMFNLVQTLLSQGVPVGCVGFQAHLAVQFGFPGQVAQNIQRFANLGLEVRFTELDVRMQLPRTAAKDTTQATYYANIINACNASAACSGVTIWGFTDRHSWVPQTFQGEGAALIYDENYNPKPSYTSVRTALDNGSTTDTTPPSVPGNLSSSGITASSVNLSWSAATDNVGVTAYDVYRAPGANGGTFAQVGVASGTTFSNTGLAANTTYRFQVTARDAANNASAPSGSITLTTLPGSTGSGCSATVVVQNQWNNGYVVQPNTVTNTGGATINSWTVTFTLPAGHTIVNSWNAQLTISGQTVTARNMSYNGTVPANGSTTFGFQASRPNGDTQVPSGGACSTP